MYTLDQRAMFSSEGHTVDDSAILFESTSFQILFYVAVLQSIRNPAGMS